MLGIELRAGTVVALAVDDDGRVIARAEAPHGSGRGADQAALEALGTLTDPGRSKSALGVAAQSPESPACQAAVQALATRYAGPFVRRGADASGTAAAVAEAWIGAARGVQDVAFLAVDDHASAGILRGGEPMIGAHRRAPSIAWLALNPVEREDYRRIGCFEAEVASAGIVRRIIWRIKTGDHSSVQDAAQGHLATITADHVFAAAREGDGVAISVMRDTAKYLGMAAANLIAMTDPEMLVVGGIMASAADLLMESVRGEIARRLPSAMIEELKIAQAVLGGDAAAVGAARLAAVARP